MITEIGYKNFKCFGSEVTIPTSRINLLTGINGRGKSTVLQGLLLMRQSPEHSRTTDQIIFNGSCVELGTFDDVRNSELSRTESVEFSFTFQSNRNTAHLKYILKENEADDMVAQIDKVYIDGVLNDEVYQVEVYPRPSQHFLVHEGERLRLVWRNLLFENSPGTAGPLQFIIQNARFTSIHYVSADRIGPREFYPKQSFTDFPNVGRKGEYTANILSKKGQELVTDSLCLSASATNTVLDQAEAWLSRIFDGGRIKIETTSANIVILSINSEGSTKTYKPTNVGFGYSYALPIIVSGLIARSGEILIIENPEAHLHPYAQSQLSRFLSMVSASGVQVFIESHSDHVLNGLRIAVLDQVVGTDDLTVLYFDRRFAEPIKRIAVESDGSIKMWPDGFFDQINSDFSRLFNV